MNTMRPFPGPGLDSFMPGLRVEEPEWVHTRSPGAEPEGPPEGPIDVDELREAIIDNLVLINDPEIPVNIYDLGLIYRLDVTPEGDVHVLMTLTAPNCPVAGSMPPLVEKGVMQVPGVRTCHVELTWEPPWSPDKASEDAQIALGF